MDCSGEPTIQHAESSTADAQHSIVNIQGGSAGGGGLCDDGVINVIHVAIDGGTYVREAPVMCQQLMRDKGDPPPNRQRVWIVDPAPINAINAEAQKHRQQQER
jgi:hypothetical protein